MWITMLVSAFLKGFFVDNSLLEPFIPPSKQGFDFKENQTIVPVLIHILILIPLFGYTSKGLTLRQSFRNIRPRGLYSWNQSRYKTYC